MPWISRWIKHFFEITILHCLGQWSQWNQLILNNQSANWELMVVYSCIFHTIMSFPVQVWLTYGWNGTFKILWGKFHNWRVCIHMIIIFLDFKPKPVGGKCCQSRQKCLDMKFICTYIETAAKQNGMDPCDGSLENINLIYQQVWPTIYDGVKGGHIIQN